MTAEEFDVALLDLVTEASEEGGLSIEAMIERLEDLLTALREAVS